MNFLRFLSLKRLSNQFKSTWINADMKTIFAFALGLLVIGSSVTNAASLSVTQTADAYSFFLEGGADNGNFDTIFFKSTATAPAVFTNTNGGLVSGAPRPAGQAFTYPNRMLNGDPGDIEGALGLSQFGLVNNTGELSFTVASLGGTITTAGQAGGLFLGNVNMPGTTSGGVATVQVLRLGSLVSESTISFGGVVIPEPATIAMAGLGMIGMVAAARRRQA
jgi:hypothetical protein